MTIKFQVTFDCADPAALARLYFQQVPEGKTTKNRLHLDLGEAAARLEVLGATKLFEGEQGDHCHVTMSDPEGNEFCLR